MKLRGLSPNSHIHVSVSDLYIPTIGRPILLQENRWTDSENIYKSLTQIQECGNWRLRPRSFSSFFSVHKSDFLCSEGFQIQNHRSWVSKVNIPERI
jgi:hypothetical protein